MSALGLNEHHQNTVINYMRFARYQRSQRLRAVEACFQDLQTSRLTEDTFTIDEVQEMLDGLLAVVRGEVESELINTAHTNVLLLRQIYQQAEQWHLKLNADISELENRELLEKIKDFEEMEFSGAKRNTDFSAFQSAKLEPLNESGGAALLNMEIQRLKEENEKYKDRLKMVETQALGGREEKSVLRQQLENMQRELEQLKNRKVEMQNSEDVEGLKRQMDDLKSNLQLNESKSKEKAYELEGDLTSTKHELLRIKGMLELAEKDLEKKVSETAPFRNLKSMLQKKNEQMKDLRKRLSKYESPDD